MNTDEFIEIVSKEIISLLSDAGYPDVTVEMHILGISQDGTIIGSTSWKSENLDSYSDEDKKELHKLSQQVFSIVIQNHLEELLELQKSFEEKE